MTTSPDHVRAALLAAGHSRASASGWDGNENGFALSGRREGVQVYYEDYKHCGRYGDEGREAVDNLVDQALRSYAATLRNAGFVVVEQSGQPWFLVTGRSAR